MPVPWILISLASLGLYLLPQVLNWFSGRSAGINLSNMLNLLPVWFWAVLIFFLFIILIKRGKK